MATGATAIINTINTFLPIITGVITLIRNPNGTLTLVQILDQADAQFQTNLKQAADFEAQIRAKNPPTPNPLAPPPKG